MNTTQMALGILLDFTPDFQLRGIYYLASSEEQEKALGRWLEEKLIIPQRENPAAEKEAEIVSLG